MTEFEMWWDQNKESICRLTLSPAREAWKHQQVKIDRLVRISIEQRKSSFTGINRLKDKLEISETHKEQHMIASGEATKLLLLSKKETKRLKSALAKRNEWKDCYEKLVDNFTALELKYNCLVNKSNPLPESAELGDLK